jgi:FkbM family methyltransferase
VISFWQISGIIDVAIQGISIKLFAHADDPLTSRLFYHKKWEESTMPWFILFSKKSKNILDAGSNIGLYSIVAAHANPKAKIFAFEPNPNNFERLKINIHLNNFDNRITALPLAVSDQDKEISFFLPLKKRISDVSSAVKGHSQHFNKLEHTSITVKSVALDSQFANRTQKIDLIKIDVELYELHVLRGMTDILKKDRPVIFCEIFNEIIKVKTNPKLIGEIPNGYSTEIANLLRSYDYHFYSLTKFGIVEVPDFFFAPMSTMYLLLPYRLNGRHFMLNEFAIDEKFKNF